MTGGAQGLGLVCSRALLEHGVSHLAIFDVDEGCGARALDHLRGLDKNNQWTLLFRSVDVTDESAVDNAVQKTVESFDGIDILLCFAGITESKLAVEYPIDSWRRIFDVNIHGSFLVARAFARYPLINLRSLVKTNTSKRDHCQIRLRHDRIYSLNVRLHR